MVLMAWYRQKLKTKVQNIMILIDNFKDFIELIKQAIKVNNRIYQSEKTRKELSRLL